MLGILGTEWAAPQRNIHIIQAVVASSVCKDYGNLLIQLIKTREERESWGMYTPIPISHWQTAATRAEISGHFQPAVQMAKQAFNQRKSSGKRCGCWLLEVGWCTLRSKGTGLGYQWY